MNLLHANLVQFRVSTLSRHKTMSLMAQEIVIVDFS